MKTNNYLLAAFALILLVVSIGCAKAPVEKFGEIRSAHIVSSGYPNDNEFSYYVKDAQHTLTIVTDKVELCTNALTTVRKTYPYAQLPAKGQYGDLFLFDVEGGLLNQCYYVV